MSRILRHVGHKDFQKTRQRQINEEKERAAKKLKELQKAEKERKKIEEAARPYKSNWREELLREFGEWIPVNGPGPTNSTAQTFGFSVGGFQQSNFETGQPVTYTASGLGGVEASNTGGQTIVDLGFGEVAFVDAPTYGQLALAGYAKPMGFGVQRRQDQTENERIDAEIGKLKEQIKQLDKKQTDLEKKSNQYIEKLRSDNDDRLDKIKKKWNKIIEPLENKILRMDSRWSESQRKAAYDKLKSYNRALKKEIDANSDDTERQRQEHYDDYYAAWNSNNKEISAVYAKIDELERKRPINQQLDASQEFAQNVGADYMMNARPMTTDMDKFNEMYRNRWQNTEGPAAAGTGAEGQWWLSMMDLMDSGMSYNDALKKLGPIPPREDPDAARREAEKREAEADAARRKADAAKIAAIELERIRAFLGPEAARKYEQSLKNKTTNNTRQLGSMLPTFSGVPKFNPLAPLTQLPMGLPGLDAAGSTLRYAFGNYDPNVPVKGGQSAALELAMLNTMGNAITNGALTKDGGRPGYYRVPGTDAAYQGDGSIGNNYFTNASAQALLQTYSFKPTKNGVIVKDRFNLTGSTNIGMFRALPGAQQLADFLVGMGHQKTRKRGGNPMDDKTAGFDLEFTIPWERIPNDHPLRKGGIVKESTTWDKIKKYRKKN